MVETRVENEARALWGLLVWGGGRQAAFSHFNRLGWQMVVHGTLERRGFMQHTPTVKRGRKRGMEDRGGG